MHASPDSPDKRLADRDGERCEVLERMKSQSQLDFDIDFFDHILERAPDYLDVLRCQGELLTKKGLHDRALEIDRRLVDLAPGDCIAFYNLACSLALRNHTADAVAALRRSLEIGYDDFDYLECDSDLDGIRNEPAFQELLREYGIGNDSK